eukprot:2590854-Prymnesium_polylepis.1
MSGIFDAEACGTCQHCRMAVGTVGAVGAVGAVGTVGTVGTVPALSALCRHCAGLWACGGRGPVGLVRTATRIKAFTKCYLNVNYVTVHRITQ